MKIIALLSAMFGFLIAYLAWCPLRAWAFAQIPHSASWAGMAKIGVVVLIAWGGGVIIPIMFLVFAIGLYLQN